MKEAATKYFDEEKNRPSSLDEEISLSALSAQLKGYKSKHIAPCSHWLYGDKLLSDIYDETYPFDE